MRRGAAFGAAAEFPCRTVKVSFNIGSRRIDTLLFFGIKVTDGKIVQTRTSGKRYPGGRT
jgi:hypothetical protein